MMKKSLKMFPNKSLEVFLKESLKESSKIIETFSLIGLPIIILRGLTEEIFGGLFRFFEYLAEISEETFQRIAEGISGGTLSVLE